MRTRNDISQADKWQLGALFDSDQVWEKQFLTTQEICRAFPQHAGKLGSSADALFAALTEQSELELQLAKLYTYAFLHKSEDNGSAHYYGMADRAMQLYVEAGANSAFFVPEVLEIPADTLR